MLVHTATASVRAYDVVSDGELRHLRFRIFCRRVVRADLMLVDLYSCGLA
jgi:hypothetical protein